MKRQAGILAASMMAMALISGCGQKEEAQPAASVQAETTALQTEAETSKEETSAGEETTAEKEEAVSDTSEDGYRLGMAVVSSMGSSKDASDGDGLAQVDSVAAAVIVDEDGRIVSCKMDTAQNKMGFTTEGKVIMSQEFATKKELGEGYGMKAASGIGKEWYEQAEAVENYVVGMTAQEVKEIAVDESNKAADVDLLAGATVKIGDYKEAIAEAAENASAAGVRAGDKLGLGIITNMDKSKDAETDGEGQCQAYSTYAAVAEDGDGKITACIIDSTQGTVKFDAEGKITSDLTGGVKTKRQLGDAYGMKGASSIGKEWYEQAAAMEDYLVGKTVGEVTGIAMDESQKATDVDLVAGVTISIGGYQTAVAKAMESAQ